MNDDLHDWLARSVPSAETISGRYCRADKFEKSEHAVSIFEAFGGPGNEELWKHIPLGPFGSAELLGATFDYCAGQLGWQTFVFFMAGKERPVGMASYMRLRPEHGSAEVGCVVFSSQLQRTRAATEAMFLMASHIFDDLGYRRYEWKCNDQNQASKAAAERLGFVFEGVFRKDMVVKGKSRDTAWFSMTDEEWLGAKAAFSRWLAPDNFDETGMQVKSLAEIRSEAARP